MSAATTAASQSFWNRGQGKVGSNWESYCQVGVLLLFYCCGKRFESRKHGLADEATQFLKTTLSSLGLLREARDLAKPALKMLTDTTGCSGT